MLNRLTELPHTTSIPVSPNMDIRTYRATTMHEALALVRQDLGPDAAVLHTREVRRGGLGRWLHSPRQIEVTASSGVNVPSRLPAGKANSSSSQPVNENAGASSASIPPQTAAVKDPPNDQLRDQISELQLMVRQLCRRSNLGSETSLSGAHQQLFAQLIDAGMSEDDTCELLQRLCESNSMGEAADPTELSVVLARLVQSEISVSGPIQLTPGTPRVVALVGPTGVGKTSTIAKLATSYRLEHNASVGLITADIHRIGAIEQLRAFADIIALPVEVVSSPEELDDAKSRMEDLDLVLIDTAGSGPRDASRIDETRALLGGTRADEVHLVLSAVADVHVLEQTVKRFGCLGVTRLLLTKLDESVGLGTLMPLVRKSDLPVSYLTTGQNVPDDMEVAASDRMARLILGIERPTEQQGYPDF